jgi:hypothetical protein
MKLNYLFDLIKREKFQFGTILCFVLPPIGMLFLFLLSFVTLYKNWKDKQYVSFSLVSLFFLCLLISTVCAAYQMENVSLLVSSMMVLGYWGLYLRVRKNGSRIHFQKYKWIIIFGGIYNCLIGWSLKWISVNPVLGLLLGIKQLGETDNSRLFGSSYNSNFAMYLLLVAIAFMLAEMNAAIWKKKYLFLSWQIPLLLVLSYGVITTGSRAGYVTMIILYMLFFLRLNKIIFITMTTLLLFQIKRIYELMPRNDNVLFSTQGRENIWTNSIYLWKEHFLFGTTPLGFQEEYFKFFNDNIVHAHNLFIGFFAEFGIVGGIAFLILLCTTAYKALTLFFYKENINGLLDYFLLSLPIIVLTGILDEPTFSPQIALPTIILLGYWDKYTTNFSFAFLAFPAVKLKKLNKMHSGYPNVRLNTKKIN